MFNKIFVEQELRNNKNVLQIISKLKKEIPVHYIEKYTDVFEKVKKPYLQKQNNLNLFLASKKGELVKEAPPAYGFSKNKHYYFFHSLNCIFECEYCYLQGYFNSPDIVYFVNYEDVGTEIKQLDKNASKESPVWFHMGEFSDSLSLSSLSNDIEYYFKLFSTLENSFLELRTKSINIKQILAQNPVNNIITSFTLGPSSLKSVEKKIPSPTLRIKAMRKLIENGFKVGLHLDPVIYHDNFEKNYFELIQELSESFELDNLKYISIGVVRFTKDSYRQLLQNYPDSVCQSHEFTTSFDGKIRYPRPIRLKILNYIKRSLVKHGAPEEIIYLCME